MSAFFFGPPDRQLFGFHHAPEGAVRGALLLCPPWGTEYQNAHRTLRVLATRMARSGWHALRFDWSGSGDSWGDGTDADLDVWLDDLDLAAAELVERSGWQTLDVLGLRLGAVLAARAARRRMGSPSQPQPRRLAGTFDRLVLWDPITEARPLLEHTADARGTGRGAVLEISGHVVSERFRADLGQVGRADFGGRLARRVLVVQTGETVIDPDLFNPSTEFAAVPDAFPWVEDVAIWSGRVPARSLDRIHEWLNDR